MSETYSYRVDSDDVIVEVSENWKSFVDYNLGADSCLPEQVIGSSLWSHVRDPETRHLYEIILEKVRSEDKILTFPFRCDSPSERRFLELTVYDEGDGTVHFDSAIIRTEPREAVGWLNPNEKRSDEFLRICSMCKKVAISEEEWVEIEGAMQALRLFEKDLLPQFTHSLCIDCYESAMAKIKAS